MKNFPFQLKKLRAETRRQFFGQTGLGLGAMALSALLDRDVFAAKQAWSIPSKVKSVIYLHMAGSPSQLELFDHKPALGKLHDTECPKEFLEGKRFAFIRGVPKCWDHRVSFSSMEKGRRSVSIFQICQSWRMISV